MPHPFKDLFAFQRDPLNFFLERGRTADAPVVKLKMGPAKAYLISDPEVARNVLRASEDRISKGRLIYKLREIIGESSMVLTGDKHAERRKVLHNQLSKGVSSSYVPEITSVVRRACNNVVDKPEFDAHDLTAQLATRIIATIIFGGGVLSSADEMALIKALHLAEEDLAAKIFKFLPELPWVTWRKKQKLKVANRTMQLVVQNTRQQATKHSLIDALEALDLSDKALHEEILLLLLAGHHTSGSAATWLLYFLATKPEVAAAIREESQMVYDESGEINPTKLAKASKTLAFVKETLRLYPSAFWMSRETEVAMNLGGVDVPAGASLLLSPWQFHRDEKYWDRPDEFDLDRDFRNPAFMPFGYGPRVCVGMSLGLLELQVIALEVASTFDLSLVDPSISLKPTPHITIVPPEIRLSSKLRQSEMMESNQNIYMKEAANG